MPKAGLGPAWAGSSNPRAPEFPARAQAVPQGIHLPLGPGDVGPASMEGSEMKQKLQKLQELQNPVPRILQLGCHGGISQPSQCGQSCSSLVSCGGSAAVTLLGSHRALPPGNASGASLRDKGDWHGSSEVLWDQPRGISWSWRPSGLLVLALSWTRNGLGVSMKEF